MLQNNLISWLLEEAQGSQRTVYDLTVRILAGNATVVINIGNVSPMRLLLIHRFLKSGDTVQAFTDILYDLAAHPEYVAPMREEVEAIIEAEGWTKASLGNMRRLDSFVEESQRIGIGGGTFSFPALPQIRVFFLNNHLQVRWFGGL
jgi:hypothetical protein